MFLYVVKNDEDLNRLRERKKNLSNLEKLELLNKEKNEIYKENEIKKFELNKQYQENFNDKINLNNDGEKEFKDIETKGSMKLIKKD